MQLPAIIATPGYMGQSANRDRRSSAFGGSALSVHIVRQLFLAACPKGRVGNVSRHPYRGPSGTPLKKIGHTSDSNRSRHIFPIAAAFSMGIKPVRWVMPRWN
jgi:hypothetical protein